MLKNRIVSNVRICGGEPCVKGTRIPVKIVLSHLAANETPEEILRDFPKLTKTDIQACLQYASYLASERVA